jgi:hypothetical protein
MVSIHAMGDAHRFQSREADKAFTKTTKKLQSLYSRQRPRIFLPADLEQRATRYLSPLGAMGAAGEPIARAAERQVRERIYT